MSKHKYVLENETHKILCNFEIQTDRLIQNRRPDLVLINKKNRTCHLGDFTVPADEIKRKRKDRYLDLASDIDTSDSWSPWEILKNMEKRLWEL